MNIKIIAKLAFYILMIFVCTPYAWSNNTVSIDNFKKLSLEEREKVLSKISPALKEEYYKVHVQLMLELKYGGEDGWKRHQEGRAMMARSVMDIDGLFVMRHHLWDVFFALKRDADVKSGKSVKDQISYEKQFDEEQKKRETQYLTMIRPLIVKLAPTEDALALNRDAGHQLEKWRLYDQTSPSQLTIKEMNAVDGYLRAVLEKLKNLPKLSSSQLQQEIDTLPQEELSR